MQLVWLRLVRAAPHVGRYVWSNQTKNSTIPVATPSAATDQSTASTGRIRATAAMTRSGVPEPHTDDDLPASGAIADSAGMGRLPHKADPPRAR